MTIFVWDHKLETGVPLVDQQHRQIFEAVNRFLIRYERSHSKSSVEECLQFLQQYIQYHFQTEEAFQSECRYEHYRRHQALHKGLKAQVKIMAVQLETSNYASRDVENFYTFVVGWVKEHILVEDLAFAQVYKEYIADKSVEEQ